MEDFITVLLIPISCSPVTNRPTHSNVHAHTRHRVEITIRQGIPRPCGSNTREFFSELSYRIRFTRWICL